MSAIYFKVISLQGVFLDLVVDFVKFPGPKGETGILSGHAPLLTLVEPGLVTYVTQGLSQSFETFGGLVEVKDNTVVLLVDYCSLSQVSTSNEMGAVRTATEKESSAKKDLKTFHQLYAQLSKIAPALKIASKNRQQRKQEF